MQAEKILIADDSKLMHKMFDVLLRQFTLVHAHDGLEALQCLRDHAGIDLILLDMNMPGMSGLEFLMRVKDDPAFAHLPVLLIVSEGEEEDTVKGLHAGASAYIRKPFGSSELLEAIQRI